MAAPIPLFPLSHVLLPGMPLPLHIFEPRYRDLLHDVTAQPGGGAFGVVALRTGTEALTPGASGAPGRPRRFPDVEEIGTIAEILEVESRDDGTSEVLSVGSRRFRVLDLVPDGASYLRAHVEYLDEPDGELTAEQQQRARELIDVYDAALIRLAGRGTGAELPDDANQLSYHLAARLPLPPADRQALLITDTTGERLDRLVRLLQREIALLRATRSIAVSPTVLRMIPGLS